MLRDADRGGAVEYPLLILNKQDGGEASVQVGRRIGTELQKYGENKPHQLSRNHIHLGTLLLLRRIWTSDPRDSLEAFFFIVKKRAQYVSSADVLILGLLCHHGLTPRRKPRLADLLRQVLIYDRGYQNMRQIRSGELPLHTPTYKSNIMRYSLRMIFCPGLANETQDSSLAPLSTPKFLMR